MKRIVLFVLALASFAAPATARVRVVRHPAEACSFSLLPAFEPAVVPAAGIVRGIVFIHGQTASCAQWNAYTPVDWVTVEAAPMDAQPAAYVTVAPNTNPEGRAATLVIAGIRLDITQEGAPAIANPNNLITNGGFDANIDHWTWYDRFPVGRGAASWSALDANGSPASGSILMRDRGRDLAFQRLQCIPAQPRTLYRFGAKVRTGAPREQGEGALAFVMYPSPDCSGDFTDYEIEAASPAEPNVWEAFEFTMRTGSRTQSVLLVLASAAEVAPFDTWFDDVFVEPVAE